MFSLLENQIAPPHQRFIIFLHTVKKFIQYSDFHHATEHNQDRNVYTI